MPELPEVETVVRDLRPEVVGCVIQSVRAGRHSLRQPWQRGWSKQLNERKIKALRRRGKWILADLDDCAALLLHLGMTGQLTVHDAKEKLKDHTHLAFRFDNGRELRFRDVRRFGSATYFPNE